MAANPENPLKKMLLKDILNGLEKGAATPSFESF